MNTGKKYILQPGNPKCVILNGLWLIYKASIHDLFLRGSYKPLKHGWWVIISYFLICKNVFFFIID